MLKRWIIIVAALALVGAGTYLGFSYLSVGASAPGSDDITVEIPIESGSEIIAEGRVVPLDDVTACFAAEGIVRQVLVAEGDQIEAGQVLARLDLRSREIGLAQAVAQEQGAQARLDLARRGPDAVDLEAVLAGVEVARAGLQSAQGGLASATANLARATKSATEEELAIAGHQVEQAKNALWAAQAQRDAICGRVGKGAQEADCDAAQAGVQQTQEAVYIAELGVERLLARPLAEEVAAAQAQVLQAQGQVASVEAQVLKAEADYRRAAKGPSAESVRMAEADLAQAQTAVRHAQLALEQSELRAPRGGTVVRTDLKVGQPVSPSSGSVLIADLTRWVVETTDLSELSVVQVQVGDQAILRFDALPDVELKGVVTDIAPLGELQRGEITYKVTLSPQEPDPRLAWNMTSEVSIIPSQPNK